MKRREKLPARRPAKKRRKRPNAKTETGQLQTGAPKKSRRVSAAEFFYLLEDVELPDGMVVDVSIHLRPKPPRLGAATLTNRFCNDFKSFSKHNCDTECRAGRGMKAGVRSEMERGGGSLSLVRFFFTAGGKDDGFLR